MYRHKYRPSFSVTRQWESDVQLNDVWFGNNFNTKSALFKRRIRSNKESRSWKYLQDENSLCCKEL